MNGLRKGSLVTVGTGIQLINHITHEAVQSIRNAQKVVHVVNDYPTQRYIQSLNPDTESLNHLYGPGKPRSETYRQMVDVIMGHVRSGLNVCAVFYGHPGVFVNPSHAAIEMARNEGYEARMLPGISAEDCLFADLGLDPGSNGCQSFEATDFLVHHGGFDPTCSLILWQVGIIGVGDYIADGRPSGHIGILVEVLREHYGSDHEVVVYEASPFPYPIAGPMVQRTTVGRLSEATMTTMTTLYVPPLATKADRDMLGRLGLGAPQRS
ncbi:MAG: hypothetical protein ISF22_05815 [Methanomassiliicoccus sp.]|nr:hypothetical protein [Methanomassiliicoccus sp.]